jgi:hypothetical protein
MPIPRPPRLASRDPWRRDKAGLPLIERKALLKPLIADGPELQVNDHMTGTNSRAL